MNIKNMRKACLGLTTLVCLVAAQTSLAAQYCNAKNGYCVQYPTLLRPQPEADNGDGRRFILQGSPSTVSIFASNAPSVLDQTDKAYLTQLRSEAHQHSLAYESLKGNRYAYSYLTPQGNIFYGWAVVQHGTAYQINFEYPQTEKSVFNPIIKQMTQSLTTP